MDVTQLTKCVEPSLVYKTEYKHRSTVCASYDFFLNTIKELKQRSKWWKFGISSTKINISDRHLSPDCLTFFRVLGKVCCACRSIFSHPFLLSSPLLSCPLPGFETLHQSPTYRPMKLHKHRLRCLATLKWPHSTTTFGGQLWKR